uniref:Uncharacterized protein n=1 Tax=Caenorhabditis japonica TaxID=281687 RepID=A0A8R1DMX0_CAEJA
MGEHEKYKRLFDEKHRTATRKYPEPGSRVLVKIPAEKLGAKCPKLINKWKGPFRVFECSNNSATLTPVLGKGKDVICVPFDHLRVVPDEMGDEEIKTKKGRAKKKVAHLEGDFCDEVSMRDPNETFFRHIFSCRCSRPCVFYPPSATTARTTSPSQLVAMMNLLELKPELAQKPTELLLLAQANLPFEVDIPSQEALLAMAHCPTLQLMCREEPAWNIAFTHTFSALMRKFFGEDFTSQPVNTLLVLAPGVRESTVTLAFTKKLVLKSAESAEDLLLEQLNRKR